MTADMSAVIVAKSDQWNADDFVNGARTFTVEDVTIRPGTEQPVQIKLSGSNKFFRPCKTVSRVLVAAWGADANAYRGRSLTLYTDPSVTWGGMKVGGIRVSHMSDIAQPLVIALQEKKGSRKMTTVQPLKVAPSSADDLPDDPAFKFANAYVSKVAACTTLEELAMFEAEKAARMAELAEKRPDQHKRAMDAAASRFKALEATALEGRSDDQHGDQFDGGEA